MIRTAALWSPTLLIGAAFTLLDPPVSAWQTWAALGVSVFAVRLARDTGQLR